MALTEETVILVAEDDPGHATLIERNLRRAGITNEIVHLRDGQETLDFFFRRGGGPHRRAETAYVLLLDIRMPKVDGLEVLRQLKRDDEFRKLPVIVVTTTDDPREVERCHQLGCGIYITKPVEAQPFMDAMRQLGLLLQVIRVPQIDGAR